MVDRGSSIHLSIGLYFISVWVLIHPLPLHVHWSQFLNWCLSLILRNKDGKSELDFDTDQYDILVSDFDAEEKDISGVTSQLPETEYSLRVSKNSPSTVGSTISYNMKTLYTELKCRRAEMMLCWDTCSPSTLKQFS